LKLASRAIFYISDGTGITAEAIGHSLLTQFDGINFQPVRVPFIDSEDKAREVVERIEQAAGSQHSRPLVISTLVDPVLSTIISGSSALVLDVFDTFGIELEKELGHKRTALVGQAHGLGNLKVYENRMDATNYALKHDDGADVDYHDADVILVGVSRSGKTPTCLYLALHFGIKPGNYPLTEDDMSSSRLPAQLMSFKRKLFGLTIDPLRLHQIREERRAGSRYSALRQCQREVADAESMYRLNGIPCLDTTHLSVEEIASKILVQFELLQRSLF
jgi:regulator of PEP synthase PpsR (kinase-PPPase family)